MTVTPSTSTESASGRKPARFAALESRNFRLLWTGLLLSNAGTWMASTAEGWLVTELKPNHDAFWLGVIAVMFAIPMIILPPIGGAIADRISRVKLLWIVQSVYLVMSTGLAVLVIADRTSVGVLVGYSFINGTVLAFDSPARHSLLPDILSREQLTSGVSLNSVAFSGASLVGPAVAGALIPVIGIKGVFTINAVSCLATLVALGLFRDVVSTHRSGPGQGGVFSSIRDGVRFVASVPLLSGIMLLSTAYGLFARSYGPMLAVFARDVFRVDSGAFGFMVSAGGLGTLIGAFGLASRGDVRRKGIGLAIAMSFHAVLLFTFAASGMYWIGVVSLLVVGMLSALAGALMSTTIQLAAPNELRGRTMSIYVLTLIGVPSVGAFLLGGASQLFGPQVALSASAVLMLIAVGTILSTNRDLRGA